MPERDEIILAGATAAKALIIYFICFDKEATLTGIPERWNAAR